MVNRSLLAMLAVSVMMVNVFGPAAAASLPAEALEAPSASLAAHTYCFLLPVVNGESFSAQWCTSSEVELGLSQIALYAPAPWAEIIVSSVVLGVDYEGMYSSGSALTWYGSDTCASDRSYAGNNPYDWVNVPSSAVIGSGSGCKNFKHFDYAWQQGTSLDCSTNQPCDNTRMYIQGFDNKAESVRFTNYCC